MEANLLKSLRKYRPRDGSDPLENFVTEAFAWLLRNYPEFSSFFVKAITEKLSITWPEINKGDCEWITQYNFDGVFPDMVAKSSSNHAIIFEHKVWSELHNNQLKNYKSYADNNFVENKVVLITATKYQHAQDPDLALCWSDVYSLISDWLQGCTNEPFMFPDFLSLLKSEGLGPPAPISHESIMYYYASVDLKKNIGNLIRNVESRNWEVNIKKDYEQFVEDRKRGIYGEADGRIGLQLLNSWSPGIFVGILLDGKDHCTKPINISKGPDFCLILDFASKWHDVYPSSEEYINLVSDLSTKVGDLADGWQFYNHLEDNNAKSKNKWHPLHIRKPMLDVFAGLETVDEQANAFYETANELIKIVVDNQHFIDLRDELK